MNKYQIKVQEFERELGLTTKTETEKMHSLSIELCHINRFKCFFGILFNTDIGSAVLLKTYHLIVK